MNKLPKLPKLPRLPGRTPASSPTPPNPEEVQVETQADAGTKTAPATNPLKKMAPFLVLGGLAVAGGTYIMMQQPAQPAAEQPTASFTASTTSSVTVTPNTDPEAGGTLMANAPEATTPPSASGIAANPNPSKKVRDPFASLDEDGAAANTQTPAVTGGSSTSSAAVPLTPTTAVIPSYTSSSSSPIPSGSDPAPDNSAPTPPVTFSDDSPPTIEPSPTAIARDEPARSEAPAISWESVTPIPTVLPPPALNFPPEATSAAKSSPPSRTPATKTNPPNTSPSVPTVTLSPAELPTTAPVLLDIEGAPTPEVVPPDKTASAPSKPNNAAAPATPAPALTQTNKAESFVQENGLSVGAHAKDGDGTAVMLESRYGPVYVNSGEKIPGTEATVTVKDKNTVKITVGGESTTLTLPQ